MANLGALVNRLLAPTHGIGAFGEHEKYDPPPVQIEAADFIQKYLNHKEAKLQRSIVSAACVIVNGVIICSPRHFDEICRAQIKAIYGPDDICYNESIKMAQNNQGFVDQRGVFLTRTEAWPIALAAGQILRRVGGDSADGGTLYSENLY